MNYTELAERVTAQLVDKIETGTKGHWQMPWHTVPGLFDVRNAATGKPYTGANVVTLAFQSLDAAYPTSWYCTFRQWSDLGAQVRRGEKASRVIRWVPAPRRDETRADDQAGPSQRRIVSKVYAVFNAAQVDCWEPPDHRPPPILARNQRADNCISATGAQISYGHNHAAYNPEADRIELPAMEQFHDAEAMYSTALHELCHWTGHPSRLSRDLTGRFGDDAYAAEELVAELGAAIACAHLDIIPTPRADHAQYLAHWLRVLKADPKALFAAATQAQLAVDYLTVLQPALGEEAGR